MSRYFTSDWHINSTNILKYANRPYKSWQSAAISLIDQCNAVASKNDCVFHVGDLIMLSNDRHDTIEDVLDANAYTLKGIKQRITANFITVEGNHDSGHNATADCKSMVLDLNHNWRNVSVGHYPSTSPVIKKTWSGRTVFTKHSVNGYQGWNGTPRKPHIHLCGHVHDKWILNFDAKKHVLNVNVGVDVWGYKPVRDSEITDLLDYFRVTMWTKIEPSPGKWTNFALTRKALDEFKIAHSAEVKAQREAKKQERYAKKGLTPEIREQRKQDGIKLGKIKKLRMLTGAGMGSCKEALDACGYDDMQKAKNWLVERGLNIAMKKGLI